MKSSTILSSLCLVWLSLCGCVWSFLQPSSSPRLAVSDSFLSHSFSALPSSTTEKNKVDVRIMYKNMKNTIRTATETVSVSEATSTDSDAGAKKQQILTELTELQGKDDKDTLDKLSEIVKMNFSLFDFEFYTLLQNYDSSLESNLGLSEEKKTKAKQRVEQITLIVNAMMEGKMVKANDDLREILQAGDLKDMEKTLKRKLKRGAKYQYLLDVAKANGDSSPILDKDSDLSEKDEFDTMAFSVILTSNIEEATKIAEEHPGAVRILEHVNSVLQEEMEKDLPAPVVLLRKLLRAESQQKRMELLVDKLYLPGIDKTANDNQEGEEEEGEEKKEKALPSIEELSKNWGIGGSIQPEELLNALDEAIAEATPMVEAGEIGGTDFTQILTQVKLEINSIVSASDKAIALKEEIVEEEKKK